MDPTLPLDPEQFAHLSVRTMRRSALPPKVCCVCHTNYVHYGRVSVCNDPFCVKEAMRLNWWVR